MGPRMVQVAGFYSPHLTPLGVSLHRLLADRFVLGYLGPVAESRKAIGWCEDTDTPSWVLNAWKANDRERLLCAIEKADCVVYGQGATDLVRRRILDGKLTFRYMERPFKRGLVLGYIWWLRRFVRELWPLDKENHHLLAAGAFCPGDMRWCGVFTKRTWVWGYFVSQHTMPFQSRRNDRARLLWAGRMINWKRLDLVIEAASQLKIAGFDFTLDVIGDGPKKAEVMKYCERMDLHDIVRFLPVMSPESVREAMLLADVFVAASNRREGWGAVINEAMDLGCCVVASDQMGAALSLIEHGRNGFLFRSGMVSSLVQILAELLRSRGKWEQIAREAQDTIRRLWSPDVAAERLVCLTEGLLGNADLPMYENGPCSTPTASC